MIWMTSFEFVISTTNFVSLLFPYHVYVVVGTFVLNVIKTFFPLLYGLYWRWTTLVAVFMFSGLYEIWSSAHQVKPVDNVPV
jgi:hypothetical protein